jgi:glycosidase
MHSSPSPPSRLFRDAIAALALLAAWTAPAIADTGPVPMADPGSTLAADWQHGAFAEIFVRAYKDSNGDGIGDLRGLIQSLDYLHDLGIRGIWLMPITRSQDHDHGYAVADYRDIDPDYGNLADFDELLKQAHARGIGVIMDYVINHSAATNPLFVEASASTSSRHRSWYVWRDVAPVGWNIMGKNPWVTTPTGAYLAQFSQYMPDFNMFNPEVVAFHKDNLRFWLNRGVDGFRFDAVAHLVENGPDAWSDQPGDRVLMSDFRSVVNGYANRYMVCEAPPNPEAYAAANVCGGSFLLFGGQAIIEAARGEPKSIAVVANYFSTGPAGMATMLSNHDLFAGDRPWNQFRGDQARYRLAAATYLLMPGTPFIYYGEEIGMSAAIGLQGDRRLRIPMSWTADRATAGFTSGRPFRSVSSNVDRQNVQDQLTRPDSLLAFYKALLALRNDYPSIARGSYEAPAVDGKAISYRRHLDDETTVIVINYGTKPANVTLKGLAAAARFAAVFPHGAAAALDIGQDGSAMVAIGAQSVLVFASTPQP